MRQSKCLEDIMRRISHDITRSRVYGEESKLAKPNTDYDVNSLLVFCSDNVMLCIKSILNVNENPFDKKKIAKFSKNVLKEVFGLAQVDIEVFKEFYDKFYEMTSLLKRYLFVIYLRQ